MPANSLLTKGAAEASTGAATKGYEGSLGGPGPSAFITLQALGSNSLASTFSCLILPQTKDLSSGEGQFFSRPVCRRTSAATREDCNAFRARGLEKLPKIWRLFRPELYVSAEINQKACEG